TTTGSRRTPPPGLQRDADAQTGAEGRDRIQTRSRLIYAPRTPLAWSLGLRRSRLGCKPNCVLRLRRVYVDGRIREHGKTPNSIPRVVPLTGDVLQTLDTPLLFPGIRGGHLGYNARRRERWTPALQAAGIEHRTPLRAQPSVERRN